MLDNNQNSTEAAATVATTSTSAAAAGHVSISVATDEIVVDHPPNINQTKFAALEIATMASASTAGAAIPAWVKFCGNAAPLAAMVVFLAPMPTIRQISNDRSVGSLPLLPYSSMVANCFLWTTYGLLKGEIRIWGTNGLGLCLALYYMIQFSKHSPPKAPTLPGSLRQHVQVIILVVMGTCSFVYMGPLRDPAPLIGNVAVLFCIAMFGSPLAALRTVLRTKSAKSIPLPFTLATVLNCFLWSVFGVLEMNDANIYIPNMMGLACGIAQVVLKLMYGDGKGDVKSERTTMDLIQ